MWKGQGSFTLSESSPGPEFLFPLKEVPHYVAQAGLEHTPPAAAFHVLGLTGVYHPTQLCRQAFER